jgi:hypothetical protein
MGEHRSLPPLVIRPRPSRWLGGFVTATHVAAAAAALALPLSGPLRGALLLAIGTSLGWLLWTRVLARAPWSIREAVWDEQGWRLTRADGRVREARLAPSTYVGVRLVILNLRIGRFGRRALVLTADAVDAELLRRLRARLRLRGPLAPSDRDRSR